jgi:hypothetical protein
MRRSRALVLRGRRAHRGRTSAASAWRGVRPHIPEIGRKELEPTLGQGVLLGILGGLRTVVADLTWIRSYVLWERRDRAGCAGAHARRLRLGSALALFLENAGYAVGFDLAHWEIRRRGGYASVPGETQERLSKSYARRGIEILEEGRKHAKTTTPLVLCAAQLAEIKLKDHGLASRYYREAAEAPDAPWYAARICAQTIWGGWPARRSLSLVQAVLDDADAAEGRRFS